MRVERRGRVVRARLAVNRRWREEPSERVEAEVVCDLQVGRWEAYLRVKANKGAAGMDEQSIAEFERNLEGNLYKLWNRLSRGATSRRRCARLRYRSEGARACARSACPPSRTGSPRPSWPCPWSHVSTLAPTGIGRGARRWTRWRRAGTAAGKRTGCSILTSG